MRQIISILSSLSLVVIAACSRTQPELRADNGYGIDTTSTTANTGNTASGGNNMSMSGANGAATNNDAPMSRAGGGMAGGDPLGGNFGLKDALKGIAGSGSLIAKIDTSKGALECKLYEDKAPVSVANFVGLATGKRPWKAPDGTWVSRPAYDGTPFHRIIKGFMIQGGDAKADGSGEAGYVIRDEVWDGAHHNRAGLLCMANRGPNTNSAQFFITDAAAPHLDGGYTIFGECAPEQTVHDIASSPVGPRDKPLTPITIKTVTIAREKPSK